MEETVVFRCGNSLRRKFLGLTSGQRGTGKVVGVISQCSRANTVCANSREQNTYRAAQFSLPAPLRVLDTCWDTFLVLDLVEGIET